MSDNNSLTSPTEGPAAAVAGAIEVSTIIKEQTRIKEALPGNSVLFEESDLRSLSADEIGILEANLNLCPNWSQVRVVAGFDPSRIRESCFHGRVILGLFDEDAGIEPGLEVYTGVFRSLISNCEIGDNATVHDVRGLSNMIVKSRAIVFNCGSVICTGKTAFGNGIELPIAIETGGREVKTFAEITVEVAADIASSRDEKEKISEYNRLVDEYTERVSSEYGVIGERAVVINSPRVENVFVGSYCRIEDASCVNNCTMLGTEEEPAVIKEGAFVRDSILQWGSEVATGAIVDRSVLTEHSHVERHGKVTDSILGPNTGVAEGEITASLVGPFVGFHHQALLIAAFWPEGKGNVGYGANIGSNHTSKAPDQEIWPGEGTFFGLGVNIKFPSDFTEAPYSIIATAVKTLPQKVTFPFSLINSPAETVPGLSPAYNEIVPGWVLSDNIYTVKRSEGKFRKRNKARRSEFDFEVFRPDIMELVIKARDALESVTADEKEAEAPKNDEKKGIKDFYTDRDIPGLGKNYLKEESRQNAIETYTFYLKNYALAGLKRELSLRIDAGADTSLEALLKGDIGSPRWEHERGVLVSEGLGSDFIKDLEEYVRIQEEIAGSVQASKEKDNIRGARIIADYPSVHPPASEDGFVVQTWNELEELKKEVGSIISSLKSS